MKKHSCQLSVVPATNIGGSAKHFGGSYQRHVFWAACCLCLAIFFAAGCAKKEVKNIDAKGTNIICIGDSITFGYGVNSTEAYPAILSGMVQCPVINAGIDGDTSIEGLSRLESDVLTKDPLLVIIELGGNDFLKKIPLEKTAQNIEEMVVRAHSCGAIVALADASVNLIMGDYTKELKRIAKKYGAIYIPSLLNGIITEPSLKSDFIHPNAEGYKLIAERIHRCIVVPLGQNSLIRKSPDKPAQK